MLYCVIVRNECVHECSSLRMAKEKAPKDSGTYILELQPEVNMYMQKLQINRVFVYASRIGIFVTYTAEEWESYKRHFGW